MPGNVCPSCAAKLEACFAGECAREQLQVQVAVLSTALQRKDYDLDQVVERLIGMADDAFIAQAMSCLAKPALYNYARLGSDDGLFGVTPTFQAGGKPWSDWSVSFEPRTVKAATGLTMVITNGFGMLPANELCSFFMDRAEIAAVTSPLKQHAMAAAAAAASTLALEQAARAEALARAPAPAVPVVPPLAAPPVGKCHTHTMLERVGDLSPVLRACEGGTFPFGFPMFCNGVQCEAGRFPVVVALLELAVAARAGAKLSAAPVAPIVVIPTAVAPAATHVSMYSSQPPPVAVSPTVVAPAAVPVSMYSSQPVGVHPPNSIFYLPATGLSAPAPAQQPVSQASFPRVGLSQSGAFSYHTLGPLTAGTSMLSVCAGCGMNPRVKQVKCPMAVKRLPGEKNIKWFVPADQFKMSQLTLRIVEHVVNDLHKQLDWFEERVRLSTGMDFSVTKARPLIDKFQRLMREVDSGVDMMAATTFSEAYDRCLSDALRYFCSPSHLYDLRLDDYLLMIVPTPRAAAPAAPAEPTACHNFNSARGCSDAACTRPHSCSVRTAAGLCGGAHSRVRHPG